jgi:enoyl-CoA hydratase/carnithine racemase
MSEENPIAVEEHDLFAIIRIERHAKRNAMNRVARQGLDAALRRLAGRFRAVILTGSETSFCAGIDLKERRAERASGNDSAVEEWQDVTVAIRRHPAIFIAAVNGLALGGGTTLINVCDLAIAADTAELGTPEMSFATYPGLAGPSVQLSTTRKRAAWMILTAERIDAATAERWGLVNKVVPAAQLMAQAETLARMVARWDPSALAEAKRALDVIPNAIGDWRQAFEFGTLVNARIASRRGKPD